MSGEHAVAWRGVSVRRPRYKVLLNIVLIAGLLAASGCSMMFSGHRVDRSKLDKLVVGVTTRAEVLATFGKPHSTAKKEVERLTIYVYKRTRNLALGVPFIVSVGMSAVRGHQLSIAVSDDTDKVLNYEMTEIDETIF